MRHATSSALELDGFSRERLASSHPTPSSAIVARARAGSIYSPIAFETSTVTKKEIGVRFVPKPRLSGWR